jgi:hypothetical protein
VVHIHKINKEESQTNIYNTRMYIKTQDLKIKNPTEKQNFQQKKNFEHDEKIF